MCRLCHVRADAAAGFKLCHVMRALLLYSRQPLHRRGASLGALRTLVNAELSTEDVYVEQAQQVITTISL